MSDAYRKFLEAKVRLDHACGFDVQPEQVATLYPLLKPHQAAIVRWMVQGGCRAVFAAFGLGKTFMQLAAVDLMQVKLPEGSTSLITLPLGVRREFVVDAEKLSIDVRFVRTDAEVDPAFPGIHLTNYESVREGKITPARFDVASLDEAAVLRSFGSKTYQEFLPLFRDVRFKFVATATPSPNRFKELIHYAGFLRIMDTGQALTRFFQRDSEKAGNLTLYPHKEREFWLWLNSWAVFLQKPSDLGFSDEGYELPELDVRYHEVAVDHSDAGADRDGQSRLFKSAALGVTEASREKRDTLELRIAKTVEIIANDRCHGPQGIPATVPGAEPGAAAAEAAGTVEAQLPSQPGEECCALEGVEGGQSGSDARAAGAASRAQHRGNGRAKRSVVRGEQAEGAGYGQAPEAEALRPDAGGVRGDGSDPARVLRDLPGTLHNPAEGRSLPLDGESARTAVHEVQLRPGDVRRPGGTAHEGSGLSDQYIVWCDLNDEQTTLERGLAELGLSYSSLTGSDDIDQREALIEQWIAKETSVFLSKPVMYGSGVNLQQCHSMIFSGIGFKAADFLQAIHRIHRFLQTHRCTVHVIYAESEREVLRTLQRKWAQHNDMVQTMAAIIREHGLNTLSMADQLKRSIGVERVEARGEKWVAVNNDCVEETRSMDSNSVDLVVTSIPFANHYEYTPSYNDFGHTDNNDHFWSQMDHLTPQLLQILRPGRVYACHVKDRINFGNVTGAGIPTVSPFHMEAAFHAMRHGFDYMGMITVVTDVVRENNQTYRLGWSEQCKDGTKMGVGSPEYILLLHKPQTDRSRGYADLPVVKDKASYTRARWQTDAHAFWRSSGDRLLTAEEMASLPAHVRSKAFTDFTLAEVYDYETHVRIGEELEAKGALPATFMCLAPGSHDPTVWHDVNRMRTLNSDQNQKGWEKHVCPLQFDIVDRLIRRYSNEGEVVFDPFGGLMTVPYRALQLNRRGYGVELNPGYWADGVKYLEAKEREKAMPTLFDFAAMEADQEKAA